MSQDTKPIDSTDGRPRPRASIRSTPVQIVRWLLVIPAAFAGWYAALMLALLLYRLGGYFCPPELVVSGQCTAEWFDSLFTGLVVAGASLAAALIVLFPTLMAPAYRLAVACLAYAAGLASALWLVFRDMEGKSLVNPALVGACIAGALMLWCIESHLRKADRG